MDSLWGEAGESARKNDPKWESMANRTLRHYRSARKINDEVCNNRITIFSGGGIRGPSG